MSLQALSLTFVYNEQDISVSLNEQMNNTTNYTVMLQPNTNSPNHYTNTILYTMSVTFYFSILLTAFRADMTYNIFFLILEWPAGCCHPILCCFARLLLSSSLLLALPLLSPSSVSVPNL
jgi:hypothetical protein